MSEVSRILSSRRRETGLNAEILNYTWQKMLDEIIEVAEGIIDWGSFEFEVNRGSIEEYTFMGEEPAILNDHFEVSMSVIELVEEDENDDSH